jgi:hypothetical protein
LIHEMVGKKGKTEQQIVSGTFQQR